MKAPTKMIQRLWNEDERKPGDGLLLALMRALSIPYAGVVFCRNMLFDRGVFRQKRLPCPVISVGNLTVGGTGKTPTVIAIARLLQQKGRHPAVLSRGYGGKSTRPVDVVSDGGPNILIPWRDAGDEPVLIGHSLPGVPVIVGAERFLTGKAAIEKFGADVLILDDAFQHRQLHRDVDIVLINGKRPLGNGFLLPRGPLREGTPSLRRAAMLLRTGLSNDSAPLPDGISLPSFRGAHKPEGIVSGKSGHVMHLETLRGEKIMAFAGIGYPETFRRGLSALGAEIVATRDFPDHQPYSERDIDELRRLAGRSGATMLLTTEKDGVRLTDFPEFRAETSFLRISMEIDPADRFAGLLLSRITVCEH